MKDNTKEKLWKLKNKIQKQKNHKCCKKQELQELTNIAVNWLYKTEIYKTTSGSHQTSHGLF